MNVRYCRFVFVAANVHFQASALSSEKLTLAGVRNSRTICSSTINLEVTKTMDLYLQVPD